MNALVLGERRFDFCRLTATQRPLPRIGVQ